MTFSLGAFFLSPQKGGKNVYFLSVLENTQDVCGGHSSFSYKIFLCACVCFNHVQSTEVSWLVMVQKWILEMGDGGR